MTASCHQASERRLLHFSTGAIAVLLEPYHHLDYLTFLLMRFLRKLKQYRESFTPWLDAFLPSCVTIQSSISFTNIPPPGGPPNPPVHSNMPWSEMILRDALASSHTVVITGTINNGVAPPPQQASTPIPGQQRAQHSSQNTTVTTSTGSRAGLTLVRVLDQSAGVFGPLKSVVDELIVFIDLHEVSV